MICAIMQPTYLPWLGYFDLMDQVDVFVFLDDVRVLHRSWGVRNRIRGASGELLLTVPVLSERIREDRLFVNTAPDYTQPWPRKHLRAIELGYRAAPHFDQVYDDVRRILARQYSSIGDLNTDFIRMVAARLQLGAKLVRSSDLPATGRKKDERLLDICGQVGAGEYLAVPGSASYLEAGEEGGAFARTNVALRYQVYEHPEYSQLAMPFISHLSVVDLLMNCGYESALSVIRAGRRATITSRAIRTAASAGSA